jgi:putative flavoprotein involved in K+ transport
MTAKSKTPAATSGQGAQTSGGEDPASLIMAWLAEFEAFLHAGDPEGAAGLFMPNGYWRDLVSFTWNITTQEGRPAIAAMLSATLQHVAPVSFRAYGEATSTAGEIGGWFQLTTATGRGRGYLRLKNGKCWTLLTTLEALGGVEMPTGRNRLRGAEPDIRPGRLTWLEKRQAEALALGETEQPYCLIVGGSQGGLALGARLRLLGVPTLIVDAHARTGDAWRQRYKSLCLHDPVWYDHLPYLPFPDDWPMYSPKDKLADWLEAYAGIMELNIWTSTTCTKATFDEESCRWRVDVLRDGRQVRLSPAQLVLATGALGVASLPDFEGMEGFIGSQHHSSTHKDSAGYRGKKCVVIGSNNSAHDLCAELWVNGADVTMVQRSSTLVVTAASQFEFVTSKLYSEEALARGIDTESADLLNASVPFAVLPEYGRAAVKKIKAKDAALYDRLRAAGFLLDFGADDSGLFMKYLRRGSGYYIDVGASELVASGEIKLKSGVDVLRVNTRSVSLSDGSELQADAIIYATGFGSMDSWAARLISPEVARKVGRVWGLGSGTEKDPGPWEGELRNMWKPTPQEGLWFHGGNLAQSRFYSGFLALQIKARMEGRPTPVYHTPPPALKRPAALGTAT